MKTVIIVSQAPLTPQIDRNTYFSQLLNNGFNVKFWDISKILHPGMVYADEFDHKDAIKVENIKELENRIIQLDQENTIYFFDFDPNTDSDYIFGIFSKYNCYCVRIDMYANTSIRDTILNKVKSIFKEGGIILLRSKIRNLKSKLTNKYCSKFTFNRYLSSSVFSNRTDCINHPDYDEYLKNHNKYPLDGKYILFVDTYFGYHPDVKYIYKDQGTLDTKRYYESMNTFFNHLETKYKIPVIIAAHPKYQLHEFNDYDGRKIIKYNTLPLLKGAECVIVQVCNTFSWITLLNKPVLMVSNNSYLRAPNILKSLRSLSNILKLKFYNIDKTPYNRIKFNRIKERYRKKYIYNYLTSKETENLTNLQIFENIIHKS